MVDAQHLLQETTGAHGVIVGAPLQIGPESSAARGQATNASLSSAAVVLLDHDDDRASRDTTTTSRGNQTTARLVGPATAVALGAADSMANRGDDTVAFLNTLRVVIAVGSLVERGAQDLAKTANSSVAMALVVSTTGFDAASSARASSQLDSEAIAHVARLGEANDHWC